jgi:hypothetical protein
MELRTALVLSAMTGVLAALQGCGGPGDTKTPAAPDMDMSDGGAAGAGGSKHACGNHNACGNHDGGSCGASSPPAK